MIPASIIQRTFYIKFEKFHGTGFTYERENKQYLITTRHTFPFINNKDEVRFSIMRNNKWEEINSKIFLHDNNDVDIAILSLNEDLSPRENINYDINNLFLSQDVYFLGFPYGKYMEDCTYVNNGFPIPFIKKGIFATIPFTNKNIEIIYLDAINNPGFSGGPCVFFPGNGKAPTICGVVKGYFPHEIDVKTPLGIYTFEENSGLVEVHSINYVNQIQID